jgi:geranylgeranyl diphosphate synthase, type I
LTIACVQIKFNYILVFSINRRKYKTNMVALSSNQSLFTDISEYKNIFNHALEEFFNKQIDKSKSYNLAFQKSLQEIKRVTCLSQSKRIRPYLVYLGYKLCNNTKEQDITKNLDIIIQLGIALEIFHSFALIHDDIIDKADTRRGEPTIETQYLNNVFHNHSDKKHLATSATILAGDLAISIADSQINSLRIAKIADQYYQMQFELIAGQIDDCFGVGMSSLETLQEKDIITMIKQKSGNYSIQIPLLFGVLLHSHFNNIDNKSSLSLLSQVGEKIGVIFQLTDDILGLFGNESKMGKSNISDIVEGKNTLLILKTYNKLLQVEDKKKFSSILGNKKANIDDINWIKAKVTDTGILEEIKRYIQSLHLEINSDLDSSRDLDVDTANILKELCHYLIEREK